jgi:class 3 adenylate cyclase
MPPETQYTRVGDQHVAYQVFGDGPLDMALVGGPAAQVETWWENADVVRYYERLSTFARVVIYDRRGTGLSDPLEGPPTLEMQMEDLHAVADAAGFGRHAVLGGSDGGRSALLYAATYPERVEALALFAVSAVGGSFATPGIREAVLDIIETNWGKGELVRFFSPSRRDDVAYKRWLGRMERNAVSPGMARKLLDLSAQIDIRPILPAVRTRTLVLHRTDDGFVPIEHGRALADALPDARFVELEGTDNSAWTEDTEALVGEVEEFFTGQRGAREPERVLSTVLFTDIVDSTRTAAELGDQRWRDRLDHHTTRVRDVLERHRGREIKTTGDGFLATFDGPARAVRAATEIVEGSGLPIRAGVHTGEIELVAGDDIAGLAVHIAARVMKCAEPREVLVSRTVRDLVVGSGLHFDDRGERSLKGVPDSWELFAVAS